MAPGDCLVVEWARSTLGIPYIIINIIPYIIPVIENISFYIGAYHQPTY